MSDHESKSRRKPLRFWGWGYQDEHLTDEENQLVESAVNAFAPGGAVELTPPTVAEFDLPDSRVRAPATLEPIISTSPYDRLVHSYGKSYPDLARMFMREVPNAPDCVAFPRTEQDITDIFDYAQDKDLAIIPFGGGTSVCGGVEADVGDDYRGTICLDMENFNRILEVDKTSRRARIQAGILGPDMEAGLKPHGLTLRHYPQSFPFVTLGGMIATRAGGHFATLYTHIDDLVESTRLLTPSGVIETRALPGSGAGPSADRMIIGSEGTLGVITEATMRLHHRPQWRATASITFDDMFAGAEAVRHISQAGLYPSNCRLLDEAEVAINNIASKPCALLVLGFESADHPVNHWIDRAVEIACENGGQLAEGGVIYNASHENTRANAAESWRNAFIRMAYWRNRFAAFGVITDAVETSITWDKFPDFYRTITGEMNRAIAEITGHAGSFSCRFTHIYPDGPAPYFTFYAVGDTTGNLHNALAKWKDIKALAIQLIIANGGTVTHHHAVGRDHRAGYEQQTSPLFRQTLAAAKASLDPSGLLNPGVLYDPVGKNVGITGVFRDS